MPPTRNKENVLYAAVKTYRRRVPANRSKLPKNTLAEQADISCNFIREESNVKYVDLTTNRLLLGFQTGITV